MPTGYRRPRTRARMPVRPRRECEWATCNRPSRRPLSAQHVLGRSHLVGRIVDAREVEGGLVGDGAVLGRGHDGDADGISTILGDPDIGAPGGAPDPGD